MKPIVTLTLNPTIDVASRTGEIRPIRKVRTHDERLDPGGGGINVARVVHQLGGEAHAVYLAGGATGAVLDELVAGLGIPHQRIDIAGNTRISFTVFEEISGLEYRFVTEGHALIEDEWRPILSLMEACDADHVVASGSLPRGMPQDFFVHLGEMVRAKGARFILDTSGPALEAAIAAGGIYLAKPSLGEFEGLLARKMDSPETLAREAMRIVESGAVEHLAVTLGRDGALLAHRSGTLRLKGPKVTPVSAVGAGDSFVGAMTLALAQGRDARTAFMRGMAAGAAAVMTPGTQMCCSEDVERLFVELEAERAALQPAG